MVNEDAMRRFMQSVYRMSEKNGFPVSEYKAWVSAFSESAAAESARVTAIGCQEQGYLIRAMDGTIVRITPKGLEFIGE